MQIYIPTYSRLTKGGGGPLKALGSPPGGGLHFCIRGYPIAGSNLDSKIISTVVCNRKKNTHKKNHGQLSTFLSDSHPSQRKTTAHQVHEINASSHWNKMWWYLPVSKMRSTHLVSTFLNKYISSSLLRTKYTQDFFLLHFTNASCCMNLLSHEKKKKKSRSSLVA